MKKTIWRKWVLISVGLIAVGFAIIGIFVPVLPTTPLLLLAAGCFVRSSPRLYNWLIEHKLFGDYIRHYRENRAITPHAKILTLILLWSMIGYSAFGVVNAWWLRVLLGLIAIAVSWHILSLKTLTREMLNKESEMVSS